MDFPDDLSPLWLPPDSFCRNWTRRLWPRYYRTANYVWTGHRKNSSCTRPTRRVSLCCPCDPREPGSRASCKGTAILFRLTGKVCPKGGIGSCSSAPARSANCILASGFPRSCSNGCSHRIGFWRNCPWAAPRNALLLGFMGCSWLGFMFKISSY